MKKLSNTIMLILLIAAVYVFYTEMVPVKISAVKLAEAYSKDKEAADSDFLNKELKLTGKVKAFYKILDTRLVLELQNGDSDVNVFCFFIKQTDETKASHLKENELIEVTGKCVGMDKYKFIKGVKIDVTQIKSLGNE